MCYVFLDGRAHIRRFVDCLQNLRETAGVGCPRCHDSTRKRVRNWRMSRMEANVDVVEERVSISPCLAVFVIAAQPSSMIILDRTVPRSSAKRIMSSNTCIWYGYPTAMPAPHLTSRSVPFIFSIVHNRRRMHDDYASFYPL